MSIPPDFEKIEDLSETNVDFSKLPDKSLTKAERMKKKKAAHQKKLDKEKQERMDFVKEMKEREKKKSKLLSTSKSKKFIRVPVSNEQLIDVIEDFDKKHYKLVQVFAYGHTLTAIFEKVPKDPEKKSTKKKDSEKIGE